MAKDWIGPAASKNPGGLHRSLHIPEGEKIGKSRIKKAAHSRNPKIRKQAQMAENVERSAVDVSVLKRMFDAEIASINEWTSLSHRERLVYLKANPYSAFASKQGGTEGYYIDDDGRKQDAEIHDEILREGDAKSDGEDAFISEVAAATSEWWNSLTREQKRAYLKEHPRSKFGNLNSKGDIKPKVATRDSRLIGKNVRVTEEDFKGITYINNDEYRERAASKWRSLAPHVKPIAFVNALTGGAPKKFSVSVEVSRVAGGSVRFHASSRDYKVIRNVLRRNGKLIVYHDMFRVKKGLQGKHSVAKNVLRDSIALYKKMGVSEVSIDANIDVGGYAWAKYGFVPTKSSWKRLRIYIGFQLDTKKAQPYHAEIRKLLKNSDPKTIWKLCDMQTPEGKSIGKEFLLGSDWYGSLDLSDKDSMSRFKKYIG